MRKGPILLVEDVPNVLELLEVTLRFRGYQTVSARNGLEALEVLENTTPALIITDILMPRMDGFAFIQRLRTSNSSLSRIPVIFLSATFIAPEDKRFALSLGATRFIEKPIDTEDFLLTVAEIIAQDEISDAEPLNMLEFYRRYRERLEEKLRQKNTQIARTERVISGLPDEQLTAFLSMLKIAQSDRESIRAELREVYRMLDNLKPTGT